MAGFESAVKSFGTIRESQLKFGFLVFSKSQNSLQEFDTRDADLPLGGRLGTLLSAILTINSRGRICAKHLVSRAQQSFGAHSKIASKPRAIAFNVGICGLEQV